MDTVANRSGTRILFSWSSVTVGAFDCWPDDTRWRSVNCVDEGHVIAFPGTPVEITQDGHHPAVTDANQVVLYNRDQTYRRRLVAGIGDHCTYLVVAPDLLEELAWSASVPMADPYRRPFADAVLPLGRREHLEHRLIVRHITESDGRDQLEIQERLVRLVRRAALRGQPGRAPRCRRRASTAREHRRIVEAARELLALDLDRPVTLDQLARQIGTSAFHLSRVFRERSGTSLHAYRDELRLRTALPAVLESARSLTDIALDHGYASSSHFTDRFRARYGMPPSKLRGRVTAS